jgi:hypothetical protein
MEQLPDDDPVYTHSRREAILVLLVWILCGIYTVTYSFLDGFHCDPAALETWWGIPRWVLLGVIAPWLAATIFAGWFALSYIKDDDLGEEQPGEEGEGEGEPGNPRRPGDAS